MKNTKQTIFQIPLPLKSSNFLQKSQEYKPEYYNKIDQDQLITDVNQHLFNVGLNNKLQKFKQKKKPEINDKYKVKKSHPLGTVFKNPLTEMKFDLPNMPGQQ